MLVTTIHAFVLLAQVAAGVLYSSAPLLWIQCYAQLALTLVAGVLLCALLSQRAFLALGQHLQPHGAPSPVLAEALETARAMVVFSGFAAWPRMMLAQGRPTALHFTLAAAQPEAPTSLALYALKLFAVTLLVDAYMYAKHRLLHTPALFRFHKQHHGFPNPTPFASFAVAPVEAALTFAPVLFLCLPAAPVWAHAYALWTAGFVALNLYLHSGVRIGALEAALRSVGLNSSVFHNAHHESGGTQNYGELLYLWDSLLGSGAHPAAHSKAG
jgi:sterol desaturase/sphingolipid hydroxylase (fatty acid hydroxylase superfamily)